MIAAVTREVRFLIIAVVLVAASVAGFYFLARHIRYALADRPHVAMLKLQLRVLAAGQEVYRSDSRTYASDVMRVWLSPADNSAHGVQLRIIAADSNGYIAEGRSTGWEGRCVLAVGRLAGDSLPPGETVCYPD